MTIAISVRRAAASDAVAIATLVNQAYEVEQFFVDGPRTDTDEIAELIDSGVFLVLEHDDGIAAAVFVRAELGHAYIGMLSVRPDLQGTGLGKRLVRIAEALGEALGARSVGLRIVNLREDLARWYKSLGYLEVGTSPYKRASKRPCHFIEMQRPLGLLVDAGHSASAAYA